VARTPLTQRQQGLYQHASDVSDYVAFAGLLPRVYRPEPVEAGLHLRYDPLRPASGAGLSR
jgi:hypothetical protein